MPALQVGRNIIDGATDDHNEVLAVSGQSWFYRGQVIIDCSASADGWSFIGYIAVDRHHPLHGVRFVPRDTGPSLTHVNHEVDGSSAISSMWWFCFEGTKAAEWPTIVEAQLAADELNAMIPTP